MNLVKRAAETKEAFGTLIVSREKYLGVGFLFYGRKEVSLFWSRNNSGRKYEQYVSSIPKDYDKVIDYSPYIKKFDDFTDEEN